MAEATEDFSVLVGLEKTFAFNLSGHVLHTIFWEHLSPDGGDRPDGELAAPIDEHFGSLDAFSKHLSSATATVQGSGWGVLAWEPLSKRLVVKQVYDHHGDVGMNTSPLLVFDAWEHAYYLQYRNVCPDYVQKLWHLVNWSEKAAQSLVGLARVWLTLRVELVRPRVRRPIDPSRPADRSATSSGSVASANSCAAGSRKCLLLLRSHSVRGCPGRDTERRLLLRQVRYRRWVSRNGLVSGPGHERSSVPERPVLTVSVTTESVTALRAVAHEQLGKPHPPHQ